MVFNTDSSTKEKLQAQLFQAQKMEAIASLTGGIAHDFNNLLTVINGHSEIALLKLQRGIAPGKLEKDLKAINDAGKRAQKLTQQLLAFSRKQVFEPRVINMNTVIGDMEKMLRPLIGEDIQLELRMADDLPCIKADPSQLEQVVMNLIVNSRDAILEKNDSQLELNPTKKITIETRRVYLDADFTEDHPGSSPGVHNSLVVSDTGIGMSIETSAKIFDPFFTTKAKGKGTGLGMSTVYGIVKQNNGSIYVFSEPGEGSVFKVFWPAVSDIVPTTAEELMPVQSLFGSETILLVEDDKAVRKMAIDTLKEFGYHVYEAPNGKKALKLVKRKHLQVDLLMTDMIMPEMNGRELAVRLKEMYPNTEVLYTSGYTDSHIVQRGELETDMNFIHKPYSIGNLGEKIREILDRKKKKNIAKK